MIRDNEQAGRLSQLMVRELRLAILPVTSSEKESPVVLTPVPTPGIAHWHWRSPFSQIYEPVLSTACIPSTASIAAWIWSR